MALVKQGGFAPDPWIPVEPGQDLPAGKPILVQAEDWRARNNSIASHDAPLGLRLEPDDSVDAVAPDLHRFGMIALSFPKFTDGRAYSQARQLRERYGYAGEVRATGQVLRDQVAFMRRCGFDAFETDDPEAPAAWAEAEAEIGLVYQPAGDCRAPLRAFRAGEARLPVAAHWAY